MKVAIVTRNAVHGGVETQIRLQQLLFDAPVFVAGGAKTDNPPFAYEYVTGELELISKLRSFDVVLYHWPPPWAVSAIRRSGIASVEYVHRTDTADCDKSVPTRLITHSPFLADYVIETFRRPCAVVPLMLDVDRFPDLQGSPNPGHAVGCLTTYYWAKGVDVLLAAWEKVQDKLPEYSLRCYGLGEDLDKLQQVAAGLQRAELCGPVPEAAPHLPEYALYVVPSRLEGMPVAILEALSSNIPVLCSDLEGMRDFNRLAVDRGHEEPLNLCPQDNPEELARMMAQLLRQPRRVDTRSYMKKFYSVERVGELMRQSLLGAMTDHARKRRDEGLGGELAAVVSEIEELQHQRGVRLLNRIEQMKQRFLGGGAPIVDKLKVLEERVRRLGPN